MFNNDNLSKLYKKTRFLIIIIIFVVLLSGCNSDFKVTGNVNGKQIIYDKSKFRYYIQENGVQRVFLIKYKDRSCPIYYVIQNKDKKLAAFRIATFNSKKYVLKNPLKFVIMPQRFVVLVSDSKIIYKLEIPDFTSIQWVDNHHLLIVRQYQRLIINEKGQVISDKHYKKDQLELVPHETIH